jgi:hypothetical protein
MMQTVILGSDFLGEDQNTGGHSGKSGALELTPLRNYLLLGTVLF